MSPPQAELFGSDSPAAQAGELRTPPIGEHMLLGRWLQATRAPGFEVNVCMRCCAIIYRPQGSDERADWQEYDNDTGGLVPPRGCDPERLRRQIAHTSAAGV